MPFWRRRAAPAGLRAVIEVGGFDSGGLEQVALDSALGFARAGIAVLIVSAGPLGRLAASAQSAGLRVAPLPRFARARAYARLLNDFGPTLAVSHFSTEGYRLFAQRGLPVLSFIHNVYAFMDTAQRRRFADDDRQVARYIAVSATAAAYATARLGIDAARITVIPNGIDLHAWGRRASAPALRAAFGLADSDYVFLNPAAYNLHKGHHLMAAALRRALAVRGDVRILCVGKTVHPPHLAALRARLAAEGLDRHMLLPGPSADVPALFAMADALLLPSFIEGWSLAMNEAMASGKPMILTDTGAAREVIAGEDIGIVVQNEYGNASALEQSLLDEIAYRRDFATAPALADAMLRFAADRDGWARRGAAGRAKCPPLSDSVARYMQIMRELAP